MLLVENPPRVQDLVCICDFGESLIAESDKLSQETLSKRSRGTLCIQSPEMLGLARRSGRTATAIGKATDIWSLGYVCSQHPFDRNVNHVLADVLHMYLLASSTTNRCALYEIMTGEYLFRNKEWTELFAALCSSEFQLPRAELEQCGSLAESLGMREALHEVFEHTLRKEPEARASAAEIQLVMQRALDQQKLLSKAPLLPLPGGSSPAGSLKHAKPQQACVQILQAAAAEQSTAVGGGVVMLRQDRLALSFHPTGAEPVGKLPACRLYIPSQAGFCIADSTAVHQIVLCDALHPPPSTSWPAHAVILNTHSLSSIQHSMKLLLMFVQRVAEAVILYQDLRASVRVQVVGDDDTPNSARTVPWQRPSVRCSAHTQLLAWAIVCAIQALDYVRPDGDLRLAVLQAWSDTRGAISTEIQLLSRAQALTDLAYELLSNIELSFCS
jgi:serine/threonine protein kinase